MEEISFALYPTSQHITTKELTNGTKWTTGTRGTATAQARDTDHGR